MTDPGTDSPPPAPTRRERQRQATLAEIVATSRRLIAGGEEISISAVAGGMGLTPPALYRYVGSLSELSLLVTEAIFDDVIAMMSRARDRQPADDPAAQIVAGAAAFRLWALGHPGEFRMVFAPPVHADHGLCAAHDVVSHLAPGPRPPSACPTCGGPEVGGGFGDFFGEIFFRLWLGRPFPVPAREELDPVFIELHEELARQLSGETIGTDELLGLFWTFTVAWVDLYGVVTLEVFGHVHPALIGSGSLFGAQMLKIGRGLGLEAEWDRLRAVSESVAEY